MAHIWKVLSAAACCRGFARGLSEASALHCTSLSARLLPMMHLPISSLATAVKEAIVPVTLRGMLHALLTQSGRNYSLYTPGMSLNQSVLYE